MKNQFKSIASTLAMLCLVLLAYGCTDRPVSGPTISPISSPVSPSAEPTKMPIPILVYTLVSKPFQESLQTPPYQINAEIPFLQDNQQVPVDNFNQQVETLVQENIDAFRKSVLQDAPNPPITSGSTYVLKYAMLSSEVNIISLKFDISSYFDGAAHPGEQILTYNYNLASMQPLNLDQLFLPRTDYLSRIAAYCKAQLSQRDIDYSEQGALPTIENYRNWNITTDGLMITFDMYQVAAGAAGPQIVVVPYVELNGLIDTQGPLSGILD